MINFVDNSLIGHLLTIMYFKIFSHISFGINKSIAITLF